jgi:hypothetical protein
MWPCKAASEIDAGAKTSIFPPTILAWMVFLRRADLLIKTSIAKTPWVAQWFHRRAINNFLFKVCYGLPGVITALF